MRINTLNKYDLNNILINLYVPYYKSIGFN